MGGEIFWDSCVFSALLCKDKESKDPLKIHRYPAAKYYFEQGVAGKLEIYFSILCYTEILHCDAHPGGGKPASEYIKNWFRQHRNFLIPMQISTPIIYRSHDLRIDYPKIGVADSIHVASALEKEIAIIHTFDGDSDSKKKEEKKLIYYNGRLKVNDSTILAIQAPEIPVDQGTLFDSNEE